MTKASADHQVPYPIDNDLIRQAHMIGNGRYVHDLNNAIGEYASWVEVWNSGFETDAWDYAASAERKLRGMLVEAKLGRSIKAPWERRGET